MMNNNLIRTILERELEEKNLIFPFVSDLTQTEIAILNLRKQGKSLSFIAKKLGGISRERVRQIEEKAKAKIDFKRKITETLTQKLGEVLFTEDEIEKVFLDWHKGTPISDAKLRWNDFSKKLWKLKQRGGEK